MSPPRRSSRLDSRSAQASCPTATTKTKKPSSRTFEAASCNPIRRWRRPRLLRWLKASAQAVAVQVRILRTAVAYSPANYKTHTKGGAYMKLNVLKLSLLARPRTYEGAPAATISPELALRRSVLACMLWENEFYESGETIAARIRALVPQVAPEQVAALAVEARTAMKLRHAPLLLVREMARYATHRALVAETLVRVIQHADE